MSEQNVIQEAPEFAGESFNGDSESGGFESGIDEGGQTDSGTGQSKSSRRRRRKRKKPGALAGDGTSAPQAASTEEGTPAPFVMEGESLAMAATPPSQQPQRRPAPQNGQPNGNGGGQPSGQQQGQQQGQGQVQGKRWKKKFRDRERRPGQGGGQGGGGTEFRAEASSGGGGDRVFQNDRSQDRPFRRDGGRPDNFGNLVSHQGRKVKTGGGKERGFVGPMDHSYRENSADFADAPPSTIQLRGRRGPRQFGDNQPIDHNAPRPIPVPEDAQTHIYLFVEDLFITAKVQETARKLGVKVAFIKNEKEAVAELTSGEAVNKPALIVFDLNNANAKPLTLIPKLKTKLKRSASIIGFLSTIQGDLKAKAVEAGCDTVMPKAAFSQNLPNLLRRYGVEEAEEVNFNY